MDADQLRSRDAENSNVTFPTFMKKEVVDFFALHPPAGTLSFSCEVIFTAGTPLKILWYQSHMGL
jgi:hypothetical protein